MTTAAALKPTVYIPNLNGGEMLALTLESLAAGEQANVVVVDNGSEDDSVAMLRERFPEVELIALEQNIGFGRALNLAVERVPGDPVIFLNNDVECEPRFLEALLDGLGTGVDSVAGVLVQEGAPGLIDSAGVVADRTLMGFDYLHGEPLAAAASAADPLGPTGGAALFRRAAFERVGGFDERIFLYYEDLDLALRIAAAGSRCRLAPEARALHAYSASLGAASGAKFARTGWSRGYMLRRYGVMSRPRDAVRVLATEGAVCTGQLLKDRTTAGMRGRVRGWRESGGATTLDVSDASLLAISGREALARRRLRRD